MLINVMWNFINLATGHINQEQNLKNIFGEEFPALAAEGSTREGANWMPQNWLPLTAARLACARNHVRQSLTANAGCDHAGQQRRREMLARLGARR
jgi:hypothetical protein